MTKYKINFEVGQRFGRLAYIGEAGKVRLPSGQVNRMVRVRCDCGTVKDVRFVHLNHDRIKSCGCLIGERHGMRRTKLYGVWRGIYDRCFLDTTNNNHLYKGRGITMCPEWANSFIAFKDWALNNGYRVGLQIDRVDNNGNYEPGNCRFVTKEVNMANRRVTYTVEYKGERRPLKLLLNDLGIPNEYHLVLKRLHKGWSIEDAISKPSRNGMRQLR